MPGHKRHKMGDIPAEITNIDVTETADFDNLHRPEGLLGELQKRAAALYGAATARCFCSQATSNPDGHTNLAACDFFTFFSFHGRN